MKKSKLIGALTAAALAAVNMTAFAALPVSAAEVDLDGTYHAYIGVQSASYTFRNAYDDATYGYGVTADDGTVWFNHCIMISILQAAKELIVLSAINFLEIVKPIKSVCRL